ncbi:MAG: putative baseplate assembly protein [Spirochaetales bacterium]|nr:putative baseplate assembly protein [Spirochaetales bacterium]
MPLKTPNLDDRTFEDIKQEALKLIPRYAPGWTDWNESDPGITLIELFAWMTEMILFRLNQVPDKNYIEFLKLMGIELKPAEPASVDLTFTLTMGAATAVIPKGTRVGLAEEGGGDKPIIFETDEPLVVLGGELKEIQSLNGSSFNIYTEANSVTGKEWYYGFGRNALKDNALYLGILLDTEFPSKEVKLTFYLYTEDLISKGSHCDTNESSIFSSARVVWEFWNGSSWRALEVIKDTTRSFSQSGSVYFKGTPLMQRSSQGLITEEDLYWIRCRIVEPGYEIPPRIDSILLNTVTARNVNTVKGEILGSSDGKPDQQFILRNNFIIEGSLILQADEGSGWQTWEEVDNFHASGRDDAHYTLNRLTGEITFGNGTNGRIPLPHPGKNNIMALRYLYGGGKQGNAGADSITELQSSLAYVEKVTNKRPAAGGRDEETLDEVKTRGPMELKTRHRAVTGEDFEFLAMETPGIRIRRAKALPLFHPDYPNCRVPGVISIIIVPEGPGPNPLPAEGTIKTVCSHLNKHRLLTSEVYVLPPLYTEIKIKAEIIAGDDANAAALSLKLSENLARFFHPFTGGRDLKGWPFGGDIYYSDMYKIVLDTPGVERIEKILIYKDGEEQDKCENVEIPGNSLILSGEHELDVYYYRRE